MGLENNATQQGAETDNEIVAEPTPHLNPRASAMDAIADKVDDAMREELGLPPEDLDDSGNVATPNPDEKKPEERKVIKPAEDQIQKQTRVVKIDGEEREVDDEELIRGYQKNQTASKRLEEASQAQKESDRRQAELDVREAALKAEETRIAAQVTKIQTPLSEPQGSEDAAADDSTAQAFLDAIYEGDNTKAKKLLGKLQLVGRAQTATPQPTVDLDGIADRAAAKAADRIEMNTAMGKFQKDYQDIVSNPHLAKVADGFLEEELRNKPFAEALEEAGKRTREWIAEITPKSSVQEPPAPREAARANKEKVDNLPSQSSVSSSANDDVDESASDVIRNMRKSRGLPV